MRGGGEKWGKFEIKEHLAQVETEERKKKPKIKTTPLRVFTHGKGGD